MLIRTPPPTQQQTFTPEIERISATECRPGAFIAATLILLTAITTIGFVIYTDYTVIEILRRMIDDITSQFYITAAMSVIALFLAGFVIEYFGIDNQHQVRSYYKAAKVGLSTALTFTATLVMFMILVNALHIINDAV